LQANVEPGFDEVKLKVGVWSLVSPAGPPVIVVFGGAAKAGAARHMNSAPVASTAIVLGPIPTTSSEH
jgi:hypothetical protein